MSLWPRIEGRVIMLFVLRLLLLIEVCTPVPCQEYDNADSRKSTHINVLVWPGNTIHCLKEPPASTIDTQVGEDGFKEANITVPFCKPNDSGYMPVFWRGFWPWAGGHRLKWDRKQEKWTHDGATEHYGSYQQRATNYSDTTVPCNKWDVQPKCSTAVPQVMNAIKAHKTSPLDRKRPGFQRATFVNPLVTDCSADTMPINAFRVATAWSRLTWMQRHVLRVWEKTNYCSNVWDYAGVVKPYRKVTPQSDGTIALSSENDVNTFKDHFGHFSKGNWCFIKPTVTSPTSPEYDSNFDRNYDEFGVARKFCTCPPGSSNPENYPEIFELRSNGKCKEKTDKFKDRDGDEIEDHCEPLDTPEAKDNPLHGGQQGCESLIPGFLPNDTFLITCDAAMPWKFDGYDVVEANRDLNKFPVHRWIMGIPESWFFGRFVDREIYDKFKKSRKEVYIHPWYYDDGRIDGMYGANVHYPGFPVKKNRNPFKQMILRTRVSPRIMRLTTHPDNAKTAKHPWTYRANYYFQNKYFNPTDLKSYEEKSR